MIFGIAISELAFLLVAIAFFLLIIYLIPTVIQLRNTAKAIEEFLQKGKEAMEGINSLVKKVNGHTDDVGGIVKKIAEVALKLTHLADIIINRLRGPIITLASIIAGIEFGLKHFRKKEGDKDVRE
ncbi:MAG: DUF948 domain-containing protein [Deltaproteobacteria bacterium]|nr:DUF948 domain-containing protein [Deltaproteobacteria bacterium]